MDQATKQKIADIEAKHGKCVIAHGRTGTLFMFRCPTLDEWEAFQEQLQKVRRGQAYRELAQVTLVHPDLADLQAEFERAPALAVKLADALSDLAGADIDVTIKKD